MRKIQVPCCFKIVSHILGVALIPSNAFLILTISAYNYRYSGGYILKKIPLITKIWSWHGSIASKAAIHNDIPNGEKFTCQLLQFHSSSLLMACNKWWTTVQVCAAATKMGDQMKLLVLHKSLVHWGWSSRCKLCVCVTLSN